MVVAASSVRLPEHFDAWILQLEDEGPGSGIKGGSGAQLLNIYYFNGGK